MAHTRRAHHVIWLLAAAGAFVPLFAGLVESEGRSAHPGPALPPLVEPPDTQREPELCLALPPAPQEQVEESTGAPTSSSSVSPGAPPLPVFARLTGIVLRPEGEPAAGARVLLGEQEARCDSGGRFALDLAAETGADLVAYEPGFEPALRPYFGADLTRGSASEARLVLGAPTLSLSGQVVDGAGTPLAGWSVALDGLDPLASLGLREPASTDGDGRFRLTEVPAGVHVVRAWKSEGGVVVRSGSVTAGITELVLVVERAE